MFDTSNPNILQKKITAFVFLCIPFFLNDFSNIFFSYDYRLWLAIEYTAKAWVLGYVGYLVLNKTISFADLGLKRVRLPQFIFWTILMCVAGLFLDQVGGRFWTSILPNTRLGNYPNISNPVLYQVDLYIGLFLFTGVVEEIIFRGLAFTILSKKYRSMGKVFLISSLLFGLIHWSLGLNAIFNTAIIGMVFMVVMWRTGSVLPLILAHFIVDYVDFSGLGKFLSLS